MTESRLKKHNSLNFAEVDFCSENPNVMFFLGFDNSSEINHTNYPIIYNEDYDETQYALNILEDHGYLPRVFCNVNMQNHTSEFEVRYDNQNWIITPIKFENIKEITTEFRKGISILLGNNIKINGYAIAKPKETFSEIEPLTNKAKSAEH